MLMVEMVVVQLVVLMVLLVEVKGIGSKFESYRVVVEMVVVLVVVTVPTDVKSLVVLVADVLVELRLSVGVTWS